MSATTLAAPSDSSLVLLPPRGGSPTSHGTMQFRRGLPSKSKSLRHAAPARTRPASVDSLLQSLSELRLDAAGAPSKTNRSDDEKKKTPALPPTQATTTRRTPLSAGACSTIEQHVLLPVLRHRELLFVFHRLIRVVPARMQSGEVACLRDIERLVVSLSVNYAIARSVKAGAFAEFGRFFVDCLRDTARSGGLSESELLGDDDSRDGLDFHGGGDAVSAAYFASLDARMTKYIALVDRANWIEAAATEKRHGLNKPSSGDSPYIADNNDARRSMARRKKGEPPMNINRKCDSCSKVFQRPCDYTKHIKTHLRLWKCPQPGCKYAKVGWPTEKERDRHVNDLHSAAPRLYRCSFEPCAYESKRESNCKQHMEKAHGWLYQRSKTNNRKDVAKASAGEGEAPNLLANASANANVNGNVTSTPSSVSSSGNSFPPALIQTPSYASSTSPSSASSSSMSSPPPLSSSTSVSDFGVDLFSPLTLMSPSSSAVPETTFDLPMLNDSEMLDPGPGGVVDTNSMLFTSPMPVDYLHANAGDEASTYNNNNNNNNGNDTFMGSSATDMKRMEDPSTVPQPQPHQVPAPMANSVTDPASHDILPDAPNELVENTFLDPLSLELPSSVDIDSLYTDLLNSDAVDALYQDLQHPMFLDTVCPQQLE